MVIDMEKRWTEHAKGAAGAGFGLITSELVSEFTARALGATGTAKLGVKAIMKILIGGIFLGLISFVPAGWGIFFLVAAWSGMGSILIDVINAMYAGGILRIAEVGATRVRGAVLGMEAVKRELESLEVRTTGTTGYGTETTTGTVVTEVPVRRGIE